MEKNSGFHLNSYRLVFQETDPDMEITVHKSFLRGCFQEPHLQGSEGRIGLREKLNSGVVVTEDLLSPWEALES